MKKYYILLSMLSVSFLYGNAQSAIDAYSISQPDLKGTARYMGMAGAFGALGGDLSAISQNPGGIGVYRSSDIGFTVDLDIQNSTTNPGNGKYTMDQTKFLLNNIGAVLTLRLPSKTFPNLNFGFTYNRGSTFNRIYGGNINTLHNSMSNYIAGIANSYGVTVGDVWETNGIDPYNPGYDYFAAPWITILGAQTNIITPDQNPGSNQTDWYGMWGDSMTGKDTTGWGQFMMQEQGCVNEYNIVLGGNIANMLYWGMNFDITNINYRLNSVWGESLNNAYVMDREGYVYNSDVDWNLNSIYNLSGTGFTYQFGLIFKPVQQLRLGFAFHTPTWYSLNEEYIASIGYADNQDKYYSTTNYGIPGYNSYNFRTPWRIIASAAGVLGDKLIFSFDYEWANYGKMKFSEPNYNNYYYDDWFDPYPYPYADTGSSYSNFANLNDPYAEINGDISTYYHSTNTFRLGLEFKPINALSIRAGYSYVSSPVQSAAKENRETIYTSNLTPGYRFDNNTNYITFGLGYRYQRVYIDLAYVYKNMGSEYHAYSPDPMNQKMPSPQSKVSFESNQIVLSAGYRF